MVNSELDDGLADFEDEELSESDLIWLGDERFMNMQGRITGLDGEVSAADESPRDNLLRWALDPVECTMYLYALDEAIARLPDRALLYINRGIAHEARMERVQAMSDFNKAIKLV